MASTTFVDGETLIEASWLNDVNAVVYTPGTQTAADIANVPAGSITATNVQAALNELDGDIQTKQPLDATLTAVAALDTTAGLVEQTGADTFTKTPVSVFIKSLLDDADAATARTTLGAAPAVAEVSFRAYQSTAQAVAATTFTKVLFQTENYDTGGNFASSTFTAPTAGVYMFACSIHAALADGERAVAVFHVNGAPHTRVFDFSAGFATNGSATGSALIKLAAADTVDVYVYYSVAEDTVIGTELTHFSGIRIG